MIGIVLKNKLIISVLGIRHSRGEGGSILPTRDRPGRKHSAAISGYLQPEAIQIISSLHLWKLKLERLSKIRSIDPGFINQIVFYLTTAKIREQSHP
jgi:hypothetical protein